MDWSSVFGLDTPLLEIFVRGSVMYLALFALLRVVMKREEGSVGLSDILVVVLLADAAQNGMSGDYKSVPEGILLVATIIGWSYVLTWAAYHFPRVRRFVQPPALPLIQDGKLLRRNLRHELLTEEELMGKLRGQGVDDIAQVKRAYMETDGTISVVRRGS